MRTTQLAGVRRFKALHRRWNVAMLSMLLRSFFLKSAPAVRGIKSVLGPDDGPSCAELSQLHKHFPDAFAGEELEEGSAGSDWADYYDGLVSRRTALASYFTDWVEL